MGVTGLEPVTSSLSSKGLPVVGGTGQGLTATPSAVCTRVCTSEAENANAGRSDGGPGDRGNRPQGDLAQGSEGDQGRQAEGVAGSGPDQGDPLARLAAELGKLSPEDRQRLAALLIGHQSKGNRSAGA